MKQFHAFLRCFVTQISGGKRRDQCCCDEVVRGQLNVSQVPKTSNRCYLRLRTSFELRWSQKASLILPLTVLTRVSSWKFVLSRNSSKEYTTRWNMEISNGYIHTWLTWLNRINTNYENNPFPDNISLCTEYWKPLYNSTVGPCHVNGDDIAAGSWRIRKMTEWSSGNNNTENTYEWALRAYVSFMQTHKHSSKSGF